MTPGLTHTDPGTIYQRDDGSLWSVVAYQQSPTLILRCLTDGAGQPPLRNEHEPLQATVAVGCPLADQFTRVGEFPFAKSGRA